MPNPYPPGYVALERALSKLGLCSRRIAREWIAAGRVRIAGTVVTDPRRAVIPEAGTISIDDAQANAAVPVYIALNKPRGLITTSADERGRDTVYACFDGADLPYVSPVGRLDQASEGLLLFSNDTRWANQVLDPESGPGKTYHVQVASLADDELCASLERGADCDGEHLAVHRAAILRSGERRSWLELELHGGRNRHIRRLLTAHGYEVERLVRVAIGDLELGDLDKGQWRHLQPAQVTSLVQ